MPSRTRVAVSRRGRRPTRVTGGGLRLLAFGLVVVKPATTAESDLCDCECDEGVVAVLLFDVCEDDESERDLRRWLSGEERNSRARALKLELDWERVRSRVLTVSVSAVSCGLLLFVVNGFNTPNSDEVCDSDAFLRCCALCLACARALGVDGEGEGEGEGWRAPAAASNAGGASESEALLATWTYDDEEEEMVLPSSSEGTRRWEERLYITTYGTKYFQ